jgi:RIO kinase 1
VPDSASRRKYRFDDEEPVFVRRQQRQSLPAEDLYDPIDGLPEGDRWSTWDLPVAGDRGPQPYPRWLVTELAAVDSELGVLKTGKEADVCLVRRGVPPSGPSCLLAAKRYRDAGHRMFHRDSAYREGRRVRQSRDNRAMAKGTAVGRQMIADQWARAEFAALCQLHQAGVPVPYPVQLLGTEVMQEFIGEADGTAAPRLAETRPGPAELARLWRQLVRALTTLAGLGLAHGDLSAYNLLVHHGRLIMIDLPQVVDVIAHPSGAEFLERDAANVARWFTARGLTADLLATAAPGGHPAGPAPASNPPHTQAGHPDPSPSTGLPGPGTGRRDPSAGRRSGEAGTRSRSSGPPGLASRSSARRGSGPGTRGRGSGDPGRWAEVPAPEDLGFFLLREARLA